MATPITADRIRYNANTRGASVGDCVKRALTVAYSLDYDQVAAELNRINRQYFRYDEGYSKSPVWSKFVAARGDTFQVARRPYSTVKEFCDYHPTGVYLLLVGKGESPQISHMIAVVNGNYYDSWESGDWYVKKYCYVKSGKMSVFEIDYESALKDIFHFLQEYVEDLNTKCPDCMQIVPVRVTQNTYEKDEGEVLLKCLYIGNESLPECYKYYAGRYNAHTIVLKFNPRLPEEENISSLKKKIKQKTYDWVYNLRKMILDEYKAEAIVTHKKYYGSKRDLLIVPEWARPLVTWIADYGSSQHGYRYEVDMDALPEDPRYDSDPSVSFRADTLTELKDEMNSYKETYVRYGYDY